MEWIIDQDSFLARCRNKNLTSYHQLISLIQNEIQTKDTIESQKNVENRQLLEWKALTYVARLSKHKYLHQMTTKAKYTWSLQLFHK